MGNRNKKTPAHMECLCTSEIPICILDVASVASSSSEHIVGFFCLFVFSQSPVPCISLTTGRKDE